MPRSLLGAAILALAALACAGEDDGRDSRCYRSPESVLLGPDIGRRNVGHAPGWIRLDSLEHGANGPAHLVDANRTILGGRWEERSGDSLRIIAGNDFLRTELDAVIAQDTLRGRATAHSDADLEPDAAGNLGDVRRAWELRAVLAPCEGMPHALTPDDS